MRVSQIFTMGGGCGCHDDCFSDCGGGCGGCGGGCGGCGGGCGGCGTFQYNGYRNDNFSGFERGPTRRSFLGILG